MRTVGTQQDFSGTIKAGDGLTITALGLFVYMASGSGTLIIETSNGDRVVWKQGRKEVFSQTYTWLRITNQGGADVAVELVYGFGDASDGLVTGDVGIVGSSLLQETADLVSVVGSNPALAANANRRTAIIRSLKTNNAAGARVGAAPAANKGTIVYPGDTFTLDTQEAIAIYTANAGDTFTLQEV